MSLREVLSTNLARLCKGEDSIASVCRATRINRQQFNRYLSGGALPNQRNLQKICQYFRIDEAELFRGNGLGTIVKGYVDDSTPWSHIDLRSALKLLHTEAPTSVAPGLYYAHFAHPHDPKSLMRSIVTIRRDGNLSTFRRLTGLSEPKGSWWSHFNGDHKGIILERRHWLYFVALNGVGTHEPTLLVLRWVPNSDPILGGHAAILTPLGPTITAVVVTPCPRGTTLRAGIRGSHAYGMDDASIDPMIVDALDQQCQVLIAMVRRLDLSVTPLS
jgi:transcriptional regulator with XRE-family HTH domain